MPTLRLFMSTVIVAIMAIVTTAPTAAPSTSFYVVAHVDDWQLFMGLNASLDVPRPNSKIMASTPLSQR